MSGSSQNALWVFEIHQQQVGVMIFVAEELASVFVDPMRKVQSIGITFSWNVGEDYNGILVRQSD